MGRRLVNAACLLLFAVGAAGQTSRSAAKPTSAQIERGRYLVEYVSDCFACHSEVQWTSTTRRILPGRKGSGALFPVTNTPFPIYVPNISSDRQTGAGAWSDEQLGRAIREGIGHDGRVLFPVMPYMDLRVMSDEDLKAVIAYLRTIPPVSKPTRTPTIPDAVRKQLPKPPPLAKPVAAPDMSDPVKRGGYLVSLAGCVDCHTPFDEKGEPIRELAFAGGQVMQGGWGTVTTANITPDRTGIAAYNERAFLQMMHTGRAGNRTLNVLMPTESFRHMTDQDLSAVFAFLRTLKPVRHLVDNRLPPTFCKVCRGRHGGGEKN